MLLKNVKTVRHNLIKYEKLAPKEIKNWDKHVVRLQNKELRFVILDNADYGKIGPVSN